MLRNARMALYSQGRIHDITMEHNHEMLPYVWLDCEKEIESLPVLSAIVKVQRYKSMVTATIHT